MSSLYNETDDTSIDIGDVITAKIDNINDGEGFDSKTVSTFYFAKAMASRFQLKSKKEEGDPSHLRQSARHMN